MQHHAGLSSHVHREDLFVYRPDRVIDGPVERSVKVHRVADTRTHTHKSLNASTK